ncbi:hypothetical protein SteCoe_15194 [Stentor coeruleus]|uniref:Uncharacterized protein n=1 Tax=Stentor coeruleus TaxID=5963 RepID=A0A1R2C451_9CILI|nr:hypothetical protein SteCoe_15194 [Stentor coeruleus]
MDDYFKEFKTKGKAKKGTEFTNTMKVVKAAIINSRKKIKEKFGKIKFGSKNYHASMIKNLPLLEKIFVKLRKEKLKAKYSLELNFKDYNKVVKRLRENSKISHEILTLDEDELKIREMKLEADLKLKEYEAQLNAEKLKHQLLQDLHEKAKIRQEQLNKQKKQLQDISPLKTRPKFMDIEESYKSKIELPELERRKAELAKKRIMLKPISRQEMIEHVKKYNEYSVEAEKKRTVKYLESVEKDTHLINKIKRNQIIENEEMKAKKKAQFEKRKRYAELVREIFAPKIDEKSESDCEKDIKDMKEVIKNPTSKDNPKNEEVLQKDDPHSILEKVKKVVLKRKNKSFIESKTPEIQKETKFDYLAEKRKQRSIINNSYSLDEAYKSLQDLSIKTNKSQALKDIKKLEKLAIIQEYKIKGTNPKNADILEIEEKLNDFLMESVRAKISLCVKNEN